MDRLTEGKHYHLTTWVDDKLVEFHEPMHDPFVTTTLTTEIGFTWRERLRILIGRTHTVKTTVSVGADPDVVHAVMRLARDDGTIVLPPQVDTVGMGFVDSDGWRRGAGTPTLVGDEVNDTDGRFH